MTKRLKRGRQTPAASDSAEEGLVASAIGTVRKGLEALDERIVELIELIGDEDEYDDKLASHLAWLTKNAASILGEIRKAEEHERQVAGRISPSLVMAHLRALPQERRQHVVRQLQAMDEGGVLS